ncbi:MAG: DNA-processing protein DprA [Egibacteraceae bacterium]
MSAPGWAAQLGGDAELAARVVRLAATAGVSPERVRAVVAALLEAALDVDVVAVVEALEADACRRGGFASPAVTERAGRALAAAGTVLLLVGRPGYPRRLADAWPELGAPPWVFVRSTGRCGLPDGPAVAVVGTRQPTLDGQRTAADLARLLARRGVVVVSGLARGIDQTAHRAALDAGGLTVAVLGTGFGVDYPFRDGPLRERIAGCGGLVTELLPGVGPRPHHFPWRNRIVSGLADATVVVEGRARSGALQTARLAAAQGRDVLAVPGSLNQPTARGPLDLIRDGAQPLCRLEDILEVAGLVLDRAPDAGPESDGVSPHGLSGPAAAILGLLGPTPSPPGELAMAVGRPIGEVLAATAELTTCGLAVSTPRGLVARSG